MRRFSWCELDLTAPDTVEEVYKLLNQNYVEDDDNMFRFDYSRAFLKWALRPPVRGPHLPYPLSGVLKQGSQNTDFG